MCRGFDSFCPCHRSRLRTLLRNLLFTLTIMIVNYPCVCKTYKGVSFHHRPCASGSLSSQPSVMPTDSSSCAWSLETLSCSLSEKKRTRCWFGQAEQVVLAERASVLGMFPPPRAGKPDNQQYSVFKVLDISEKIGSWVRHILCRNKSSPSARCKRHWKALDKYLQSCYNETR